MYRKIFLTMGEKVIWRPETSFINVILISNLVNFTRPLLISTKQANCYQRSSIKNFSILMVVVMVVAVVHIPGTLGGFMGIPYIKPSITFERLILRLHLYVIL